MPTEIADFFRAEIAAVHAALRTLPPELADRPWRTGGWTRKQIVGHLLDSAANNRQRFVRAALQGSYTGPQYEQDGWVAAHGYGDLPWATLLDWWEVEHAILAAAVDHIPEERLDAVCIVGDDAPVSLLYLIEDYFRHQRWHLGQLQVPAAST